MCVLSVIYIFVLFTWFTWGYYSGEVQQNTTTPPDSKRVKLENDSSTVTLKGMSLNYFHVNLKFGRDSEMSQFWENVSPWLNFSSF